MTDKDPNADRGRKVGCGWPSWRYGPDGESRVFAREEDVPGGWYDHPNKVPKDGDVPPKPETQVPLTRAEIVAELKSRNVDFSRNAPTASLYKKLTAVPAEPVNWGEPVTEEE